MISDRAAVVQALIGENQLFDIGVTIWARAPAEEEKEWNKSIGKKSKSWGPSVVDGPILMHQASHLWFESSSQIVSNIPAMAGNALFIPLHSDLAFRGLQLSDLTSTTVEFMLPRKYFVDSKGYPMKSDGLKASFTILPASPSPLDNVTSISSWIHSDGITPKRTWPFPLGSQDNLPKTGKDEAIDRLSFVIPLVQSYKAPNHCFNASANFNLDFDLSSPYTMLPQIVSRTHIRIVKETQLMNLESFREAHDTLKLHECGKSRTVNNSRFSEDIEDTYKFVTVCQRDYSTTGILETLFEVDAPLPDGSSHTEYVYAPYLESSRGGLGPKDLTPVPVWKDCTRFSSPPLDAPSNFSDVLPESLKISWNITYSAISPARRTMLDSLNYLTTPDVLDPPEIETSEYQKIFAQDTVDQANSIFGIHRGESAHPWRRLLLSLLSTTISITAVAFDTLYWYTRRETAFISVPGTILLATANLIDSELILQGREAWLSYQFLLSKADSITQIFGDRHNAGLKQMRSVLRLLRFFFVLLFPLQTTWMLMTVLRIEVVWPLGSEDTIWGRNLFTLRRMRPTHRERTSERLERSTLRLRSRIAIIIGLFVVYYAMLPRIPNFLDPLHPEPNPSILQAKMLFKDLIMKESIVDPLFVSGSIFQFILNNSSGFFAGSFRMAAMLKIGVVLLDVLQFVPAITGRPESRGGMDMSFVIYAVVILVQGWQAATLPKVVQSDDVN
ncbi:hypothetical protein D9757_007246 [Collybiopsis confluens]|uniref:Uncharacterized protein n=1 Tax=Collybiopsis confluens TaxID=2823264 RepID=A0A8H5HAT1_9AGAR|nr:hypothetical protein D9757_007246 [Collybiopsis confluens]